MQTFLTCPDFFKTAQQLDNQRLRKQRIETKQIYKALIGESKGWKNHPALNYWRGYEKVLLCYGYNISQECVRRGFLGDDYYRLNGKYDYQLLFDCPAWFSRRDIFASHRSRLLFKGRVDAVCKTLKTGMKLKSINSWLKIGNFPTKNSLQHRHVEYLEDYCHALGLNIGPNWYGQFGWSEPDNLPYVWL